MSEEGDDDKPPCGRTAISIARADGFAEQGHGKSRRDEYLLEMLLGARWFNGSTVCNDAGASTMTTSVTPSSAGHVVPRHGFIRCLLAAVLTLAPLAGCGLFHSDFPIAVGNRMANTVSVFANGQKVGEVGSNLTATFAIEQSLSGSVVNQGSPTPVAQVTFSARDMATGVLSAGASATVLKDVTTYLDVAPCVATSGGFASPCVSVSGTTNGATTTGSPAQTCTFSLSQSSQSFNTTGGTGNVTVNTSNGCAWSATSNANWVVVVSGASQTGTGVVVFQVAPNATGQARSASLSIGGQILAINQTA
jgi:hypothetical protein